MVLFLSRLSAVVVIDHFPGQFGNNLYALAAAVSLALENQTDLSLPSSNRDRLFPYKLTPLVRDHFGVIFDRISNILPIRSCSSSFVYHDGPNYAPIPYRSGIELDGFFQNESYFKNFSGLIRQLFAISEPIEKYLQENHAELIFHPKTVGIHVRTACVDWKNWNFHPQFYEWWLAPDIEFYKRAVELFDEDSLFVVCSDNPTWCKKHFQSISRKFVFIENQEFLYDFYLLTKCKGLIIAASTFGWWAGYLLEGQQSRVVYRKPFMHYLLNHSHSANFIRSEWTALNMPEVSPPVPVFDD